MSLSNDPYYCHEQIQIPPALPDILKQFTKAAIRTQPKDVLKWSHAYFKAIAQNEVPPVKMRLELPISTQKTDTGLTPGLLRILNNQVIQQHCVRYDLVILSACMDESLPLSVIERKMEGFIVTGERFQEICRIGNFVDTCEWRWFLALAASDLCSVSLLTNFNRDCCEFALFDCL
ncbi:unnamed protein product [Schistosoma turkestanicum]|nr:unnamed protein product [Schistosoma turkestanicum]